MQRALQRSRRMLLCQAVPPPLDLAQPGEQRAPQRPRRALLCPAPAVPLIGSDPAWKAGSCCRRLGACAGRCNPDALLSPKWDLSQPSELDHTAGGFGACAGRCDARRSPLCGILSSLASWIPTNLELFLGV